MNLNVIKGIVILAIGLFSFLNVYQSQVKSNENIFSYNALLQVKELINGPAYGEGSSEDFPEDPFKGESDSGSKYMERKELQYYEYEDLHKEIGGEKMYMGYKMAITQVDCNGHGDVSCFKGKYCGASEFLGEVKESERKDRF
ncbi:MAG: hypothetical protein KHY35_02570 [Bacteroides thetaiotaomicron]|uniref:Uncharacterized protein n=1 Tax=Bacteroides thetaiotaomicron TaxID=818 RepID=A0A943DRZ0_BACT4|nr:hypothetical protein [Bacteroides thetaiotaomicron]